MVGEEGGFCGVFIWINNEPCITWPSSLDILNTLGHFNSVLLLFLHKTIPLSSKKTNVCGSTLGTKGYSLPEWRWPSGDEIKHSTTCHKETQQTDKTTVHVPARPHGTPRGLLKATSTWGPLTGALDVACRFLKSPMLHVCRNFPCLSN